MQLPTREKEILENGNVNAISTTSTRRLNDSSAQENGKRSKRRKSVTIRNPDVFFYRIFILPVVAFLPSFLAYGIALVFGNLRYGWSAYSRRKIDHNLEGVFGRRLSSKQRLSVARNFFRLRSCEMLDEARLAGSGQAFAKLVEIRGLDNIKSSLEKGKGAILCGAHYGSCLGAMSLIGALGFPVTAIGRWSSEPEDDDSLIGRLIYLFKLRPVTHHLKRPNILVGRGDIGIAVQASKILKQNELIYTNIDSTASNEDRARTISVNFLNGKADFLPGAVTLSKLTGAPLLILLIHRSADWRHQTLEITSPISTQGTIEEVYQRCLSHIESAIRSEPSHWRFWVDSRLSKLGLLQSPETEEPF